MRIPWIVLIALAAFFVIGIQYVQTPAFSFPDETAHFTYVRYLVEQQALPSFRDNKDFWEAHQPPLAYAVMAVPILAFPKIDLPTQLTLLRALNLLMGAGTVLVLWAAFRRLFKDEWIAQLGAAMVALLPMFTYISSGVNNDNLANLLSAAALLLLLLILESRMTRRRTLYVGLMAAALLLTKVSAYPVAALVWVIAAWRLQKERRRLVDWLALGLPLLIPLAWFIRNLSVYGDPFGWTYVNILLADQYRPMFEDGQWFDWLRTSWRSTLGILGQFTVALNAWLYRIFELVTVVALVGIGWLAVRRRFERQQVLLLALFGLVLLGSFTYSLKFYQPQGRYLFPALGPIVSVFILGLGAFAGRFRRFVIAAFVVFIGLAAVNGVRATERVLAVRHESSTVTTNLLAPNNRWNGTNATVGERVTLGTCEPICTLENTTNFPPAVVFSRLQAVRVIFAEPATGASVTYAWQGMTDKAFEPSKAGSVFVADRVATFLFPFDRDDYLKVLRLECGPDCSGRSIERIEAAYRPFK